MHVYVHTTLAAWNYHRYDVNYTPSIGADLQNLLNLNRIYNRHKIIASLSTRIRLPSFSWDSTLTLHVLCSIPVINVAYAP